MGLRNLSITEAIDHGSTPTLLHMMNQVYFPHVLAFLVCFCLQSCWCFHFLDLANFIELENILLLILTMIIVLLLDYGIINMLNILNTLLLCFYSVIFGFLFGEIVCSDTLPSLFFSTHCQTFCERSKMSEEMILSVFAWQDPE